MVLVIRLGKKKVT